jgi:predicted permease
MGEFFRRIYYLINRRRLERELANDIEVHREMMGRGYEKDFGNRLRVRERSREAWGWSWLDHLGQDFRYALRVLRRSPVFTLVALITLTLGIGGNTAIFTLTHAMLLRSLPVERPDELVNIRYGKPETEYGISGPMFDEIKKRQQVFSDVLAWSDTSAELSDGGEVRQAYIALASGEALDVLGVRPVLGRGLKENDDQSGGGAGGWVCMLGYNYWTARFNADPGVLGRTLTLNDVPVTIVGVLPRGFDGVVIGNHPIAVLPLEFETRLHPDFPYRHQVGAMWLTVMGRRKPGATLAQARAEIERIGPGILHDVDTKGIFNHGFFSGGQWGVEPGRTGHLYLRSQYGEPLLFLQILVGLILLICCSNVAGLMLARASARRHEFAVRASLGASRMRLVRQLCVEGSLLAMTGALVGLVLAKAASRGLVSVLIRQDAIQLDLSPDRSVLLFTMGAAVMATIILALPSAFRATRGQPLNDLTAPRVAPGTRTRAEFFLVVTQVSLSVVLMVSAGLLTGTLHRLLTTDPGFSTEGVVVIPTDFSKQGKSDEHRLALYEQVLRRVAAEPNIQAVSAEEMPLLSGWSSGVHMQSTLPDGSIRDEESLYYNRVGPTYFATAGTRVVAGRDVQFSDRLNAPRVCWIDQSAAAFFFPGGNALGQILTDGDKPTDRCQVVGVVQDTKYTSLREEPRRILYWPFLQQPMERSMYVMVRTNNVAAATAEVRRLLHEVVPTAPLLDAITVRDQLNQSIGRERTVALLAVFFGALALLLAATGVYGLLSYHVTRRTREIGVRIALGATRTNILGFVIWRAGLLTLAGLAVGLTASSLVARLLTGLLFEVKPHDPATYVTAAGVLLGAAVVASYLPARRAARVDPMIALRSE